MANFSSDTEQFQTTNVHSYLISHSNCFMITV